MDAMKAILSRRSIRKYTADPVSAALVKELLEAAMSAPSAGNEQPWHFIVIEDRKTLDAIPTHHPYAQMLKGAPLAIMVCGDERLEKHAGYWVQDCAAATQNILIAAQAKGLGAVWLGVYPTEDRVRALKTLLGIPSPVTPFAVIAVGHPDEQKEPAERYEASRVHRDRW